MSQDQLPTAPNTDANATQETDGIIEECPGTSIKIEVVLYDPLQAEGLYEEWFGGVENRVDVPVEIAASGTKCFLSMTRCTGAEETREVTVPERDGSVPEPEVILDEDNLAVGSTVQVHLSELTTTGAAAAWVSGHTEDGQIQVEDTNPGDEPHHRNRFRCRVDGTYTIRIWLKPKTIVLHWSVTGRYRALATKTGRSYHFRVVENSATVEWKPGASDTDPRFWRHNLRIDGVGPVPGVDDEDISVENGLSSRGIFHPTSDTNGYGAHAGGFNTNSVGVNACGMSGSTEQLIASSNAFSSDQIDNLVENVAKLCRAWQLDPTDAHDLCTHFEVNHLHRDMTPPGKWDITWLPQDYQSAYESSKGQKLCTIEVAEGQETPANQAYRYERYVDVELEGTFDRSPDAGETRVKTDRVSTYLRYRVHQRVVLGILTDTLGDFFGF